MILDGKIAAIFGGAQGMGKEFCKVLLNKGVKVLLSDMQEDIGEQTTNELRRTYPDGVRFRKCNVTDPQHVKDVYEACKTDFGEYPDIVVNVAGLIDEFNWQRCVDVNVSGTISVAENAIKIMSKENGGKGGAIIFVASISGLRPEPWGPVYSATKHAVVGYARSWGLEKNVAVTGIRFNCICPTSVETAFLGTSLQPNKIMHYESTTETCRGFEKLSPAYVAEGILDILGDDSVTGKALRVTKAYGKEFVQFPEHPLQ